MTDADQQPDGCGCQYDAAGRMFRFRCICPPEPTPAQTLRAVAGFGGAIGDAVADLLAEVESLRSREREPRVWLPGDTVPAGVWAVDEFEDVNEFREHVTEDVLVELHVFTGDDFAAAVAAEQARRAATDGETPA